MADSRLDEVEVKEVDAAVTMLNRAASKANGTRDAFHSVGVFLFDAASIAHQAAERLGRVAKAYHSRTSE